MLVDPHVYGAAALVADCCTVQSLFCDSSIGRNPGIPAIWGALYQELFDASTDSLRGNFTVKIVPLPTWLSTLISPLCFSIICLQM